MKVNHVRQVGTQKLGNGFAQMPYLGSSYHITATYNHQVPRHHIKCVSPMTFSQKMYQLQALSPKAQEMADQNYQQALTKANFVEKVNDLFDEIVSLAE